MGKAPLDLPEPQHAEPLTKVRGADDLLSQIAGEEIDRLLASADIAVDEAAADEAPAAPVATERVTGAPNDRPASGDAPAPRETAVSTFVADGDPALEAELDSLLANLNGAPVVLSDSGIVGPPGAKDARSGNAEAPSGPKSDSSPPTPTGKQSANDSQPTLAPAEGPTMEGPAATIGEKDSTVAASAAAADLIGTSEMDQVFDQMTASGGSAPVADGTTTDEPAAPRGSIDLLKVLDPIVAKDAAAAEESAPAEGTPEEGETEQASPDPERSPHYSRVLKWIGAPLSWLPPEVHDAAGKIGILTLINATAILLWVLFLRRK